MNRVLTLSVAAAVLVIVSLFVAVELGSGNVIPAVGLGGLALFIFGITVLGRGHPTDLVVLTLAAVGMILCGKGFAYLRLSRLLFMGEAVLLLCMLFYLIRMYLGQFRLFPRTPMTWPLAAILAYSAGHLVFDYQNYGLWAARDSCMSYYCLFFFFAYQLGATFPGSIRYATRIFVLTAPIAVLFGLLTNFAPQIMRALQEIRIREAPLFIPHEAVTNATLGLALVLCCRRHEDGRTKIFSMLAGFAILCLLVIQARGAGIVGLGLLAALALLARQWRFFVAGPILLIVIGAPLLYMLSQFTMHNDLGERIVQQIQDMNIFQYMEKGYSATGNTAEWRLAWWSLIWSDTMRENPLFGLGFGTDLGGEFAESMMGQMTATDAASRTRFPHNAFFSFLGRLGLIGALLFSWAIVVQVYYFLKFTRRWRENAIPTLSYFLWGFIVIGFAVTFLQYTWEASYIALPYWFCVGLAYAEIDAMDQPEVEEVVEVPVRVAGPKPERRQTRPLPVPAR